jgi:hypothetical protein
MNDGRAEYAQCVCACVHVFELCMFVCLCACACECACTPPHGTGGKGILALQMCSMSQERKERPLSSLALPPPLPVVPR